MTSLHENHPVRPSRLAFVAALALVAFRPATAFAEAPGNHDSAVPAVAETPTRSEGWQGQRFGAGLQLTSISLGPKHDPARRAEFVGGGVQLRYRMSARWELEGAIDGGREKLDDGSRGSTHLSRVTASAIFRLRPDHRWDVYALAGVGGTAARAESMSPHDSSRFSHVALGVGVERRCRHIGIAVELRMIGMRRTRGADVAPPDVRPSSMAVIPPESDAAMDEGVVGGQVSLVANYYF